MSRSINMKISRWHLIFLLFICVVLWPSIVMADVALPTICIIWPVLWILFLPIVAIEGWIARSKLGLSWYRALFLSFAANAVSTLFGVPATYITVAIEDYFLYVIFADFFFSGVKSPAVKLICEFITLPMWGYPSFVFGKHTTDLLTLLGLLLLCIPLFFATVWIETEVACRFLPKKFHPEARRWSLLANLASYGLIIGVLIVFFIISLWGTGSV